jgi:hypothetical protein
MKGARTCLEHANKRAERLAMERAKADKPAPSSRHALFGVDAAGRGQGERPKSGLGAALMPAVCCSKCDAHSSCGAAAVELELWRAVPRLSRRPTGQDAATQRLFAGGRLSSSADDEPPLAKSPFLTLAARVGSARRPHWQAIRAPGRVGSVESLGLARLRARIDS